MVGLLITIRKRKTELSGSNKALMTIHMKKIWSNGSYMASHDHSHDKNLVEWLL